MVWLAIISSGNYYTCTSLENYVSLNKLALAYQNEAEIIFLIWKLCSY